MAEVEKVPWLEPGESGGSQFLNRFNAGMSASQGTASSFLSAAQNALGGISSIAGAMSAAGGSGPPSPYSPPTAPSIPSPRGFSVPYKDLPPPVEVTVGELSLPDLFTLGDPDLDAPAQCEGLNADITPRFPGRPDINVGSVNIDVPDIPDYQNDIAITTPPPAPTLVLPPVPSAITINPQYPDAPDFSVYLTELPQIPVLTLPTPPADTDIGELRVDDIVVPNLPNLPPIDLSVTEFESRVKQAVDDSVIEMLATAQLDQDYEQASFDAVMAREAESASAALAGLADQMAARGMPLVGGAHLQTEMALRTELDRRARVGSREIYVRRKEQELQVRQVALQTGVSSAGVDAQVYEVRNRLLLSVAEAAQKLTLSLYEMALRGVEMTAAAQRARIDAYRAQLEVLRTRWDVYQAQVQAEISRIQATTEIIRALVERTKIADAEARVYSTIVQATTDEARLQIELNKLQFDVWQAQVQAQVEQIKAYSTYGDIIRAQAAAIDAGARAYTARIQGVQARVDAQSTAAKLRVEVASLEASLYEIAVRAEQARLQALVGVLREQLAVREAAARYAIAYAQAIAVYRESEARINSAMIQAVSEAYRARVNALASDNNARAAWYNSVASYYNMYSSRANILASYYRATVDAVVAGYQAQVTYYGQMYIRAVEAWSAAVNRQLSAMQATATQLASGATAASRVAAAALGQVVVQLGSTENVSEQNAKYYNAQLSNSFVKQQITQVSS